MSFQHIECKCGVAFTLTDEMVLQIIDNADVKLVENDIYEFKCFNPKCNEMLRVKSRQEGK
jgi:hypothetical protein